MEEKAILDAQTAWSECQKTVQLRMTEVREEAMRKMVALSTMRTSQKTSFAARIQKAKEQIIEIDTEKTRQKNELTTSLGHCIQACPPDKLLIPQTTPSVPAGSSLVNVASGRIIHDSHVNPEDMAKQMYTDHAANGMTEQMALIATQHVLAQMGKIALTVDSKAQTCSPCTPTLSTAVTGAACSNTQCSTAHPTTMSQHPKQPPSLELSKSDLLEDIDIDSFAKGTLQELLQAASTEGNGTSDSLDEAITKFRRRRRYRVRQIRRRGVDRRRRRCLSSKDRHGPRPERQTTDQKATKTISKATHSLSYNITKCGLANCTNTSKWPPDGAKQGLSWLARLDIITLISLFVFARMFNTNYYHKAQSGYRPHGISRKHIVKTMQIRRTKQQIAKQTKTTVSK